jgi:hypothetical protein
VIFVDSNVLIDVIERDPRWHDWSVEQLEAAALSGSVAINHIVVAEVAPQFGSLDLFVERMEAMAISIEPLSDVAAMTAGLAFRDHRRRRERPGTVLPDFLIGAHALTLEATLLTRDPRFYRAYFPELNLITPESLS